MYSPLTTTQVGPVFNFKEFDRNMMVIPLYMPIDAGPGARRARTGLHSELQKIVCSYVAYIARRAPPERVRRKVLARATSVTIIVAAR